MKLVGQTYWWWKDSHIDDQCCSVLQYHLRSLYATHLFYAFKADYNDLNVEPEPKSQSFADIRTDLLDEVRKFVVSQTVKFDADPQSDVVDKSEPEIVDEPDPESEVKDPLIGTHVDLPTEPIMKLSSSAI